MTIWFIRAPENKGRPEKFIADKILSELMKSDQSENVREIKQQTFSPDAASPEQFYNAEAAMLNFGRLTVNILQYIRDGDTVYFVDAFTPVIGMLDYYCAMKRIKIKKMGIFHSSANLVGDLFYGNESMQQMENYILNSLDEVHVASSYAKKGLTDNWSVDYSPRFSKAIITGLPIPTNDSDLGFILDQTRSRKNRIVFSHRLAPDKKPWVFAALAKAMPQYEFVVLTPSEPSQFIRHQLESAGCKIIHCMTKQRYFSELAQSKIIFSSAVLETFGYSVIEGMYAGCLPLVPQHANYPEYIRLPFQYPVDYLGDLYCTDWFEKLPEYTDVGTTTVLPIINLLADQVEKVLNLYDDGKLHICNAYEIAMTSRYESTLKHAESIITHRILKVASQ